MSNYNRHPSGWYPFLVFHSLHRPLFILFHSTLFFSLDRRRVICCAPLPLQASSIISSSLSISTKPSRFIVRQLHLRRPPEPSAGFINLLSIFCRSGTVKKRKTGALKLFWVSMSSDEETSVVPQRRRLSCSTCFDALWFCYSPVYQMQQYYRLGVLDNCSSKWGALVDCLTLKTKPSSQVQEILETREKAKPHIWTFRSPEEAASHWQELFGHQDEME